MVTNPDIGERTERLSTLPSHPDAEFSYQGRIPSVPARAQLFAPLLGPPNSKTEMSIIKSIGFLCAFTVLMPFREYGFASQGLRFVHCVACHDPCPQVLLRISDTWTTVARARQATSWRLGCHLVRAPFCLLLCGEGEID